MSLALKRPGTDATSKVTFLGSGMSNEPPIITYHGSSAVTGGDKRDRKLATASGLGLRGSSTNSQTLPAMFKTPDGLWLLSKDVTVEARLLEAGLSLTLARLGSNSFPHGYRRPSVPRAAFSHS